jgi:hypothetical protein
MSNLTSILDKIIENRGGNSSDWKDIIRLLNNKPEEYLLKLNK